MARTTDPSIPVYAYGITSYTYVGGNTPSVTFNIALSAETASNLVGYLSGNATVATPTLSGTLGATALSTLSAVNNIVLQFGTVKGANNYYGTIMSSSVVPAASAATFVIEFNSLNFYTNTIFYVSCNSTTAVLNYSGNVSTLDNPLYGRDNIVNSPDESNNTFRTVGEHLRKWVTMG